MTETTDITPADLEAKFRDIQSQVNVVAEDSKKRAAMAGAVLGVIVLVMVYFAGRRTGRRRSSVLEIRRL